MSITVSLPSSSFGSAAKPETSKNGKGEGWRTCLWKLLCDDVLHIRSGCAPQPSYRSGTSSCPPDCSRSSSTASILNSVNTTSSQTGWLCRLSAFFSPFSNLSRLLPETSTATGSRESDRSLTLTSRMSALSVFPRFGKEGGCWALSENFLAKPISELCCVSSLLCVAHLTDFNDLTHLSGFSSV